MSKRRTGRNLLLIVAAAASFFACQTSYADREILSVGLVRTTVTLHEPIRLQIIASNSTDFPISLDFGEANLANFTFEAIPAGGGVVEKLPSPLGAIGFSAGSRVNLAKGESYRGKILLNEWFFFASPGDYNVVVHFSGSAKSRGADLPIQRMFALSLHIEPRDPDLLASVARKLERVACQSRDLAGGYEAARTLAYLRDPAVVPSLAGMLRCGLVPGVAAVRGLKGIGTREAILQLIGAAKGKDKELADSARRALRDLIARRGSDLDRGLVTEIKGVLVESSGPDGARR